MCDDYSKLILACLHEEDWLDASTIYDRTGISEKAIVYRSIRYLFKVGKIERKPANKKTYFYRAVR